MKAKILNASAGSGKTYQLAYKYVRDVVERPELYRHILAVTFTNKATEEMKSRILKEIHKLASGAESSYLEPLCRELRTDAATVRKRAAEARSKILHDYSRFTVLTIDTFFQRILRAFIKELGIDLNYNVEIETASVLTKSADALIEQIAVDEELLHWMTDFVQERIDDGQKWDIRNGMLTLGKELFKEKNRERLAAMQSKEELARIVGRVLEEAEQSRQRYRKLAQQLLDTIAEAGLTAADFPYKQPVSYLQEAAAGSTDPCPQRVLGQCREAEKWHKKGSRAIEHVARLQPLLCEVCATYERNIRHWNTGAFLRENYRSFALLADLYARVQAMCNEQNLLLLSETKNILAEFIGTNDAPFIYEKVGNRFERFMIDEFQDTSVKEWENFLPLLHNALAQAEQTSVLLVGDIKQSIYRWRGGDWNILHRTAREDLGAAETEVVTLQENFRSLPAIVAFNNEAIRRVVASDNRQLNALLDTAAAQQALPAGEAERLHDTLLDAYRSHEQRPRRRAAHEGYVSVELFDEQPPVVERICTLLDAGYRPCDILILVRGATDGSKIAADLLAFKRANQDPRYRFEVMTREALLLGAAPVSTFVIAILRLALNPADSISRACCNRFLGRSFDTEPTAEELAFFRSLRMRSPEEAFERIVLHYDLRHAEQHTAYLQAIHERLIAFCANRIADIPLFLRWWEEQGAQQSLAIERSESTVEITTIHKAKGLERKAVILPYCSWELDPKSKGWAPNIVWAEASGDAAAVGRFPVRFGPRMAESDFSAEYYRERVYAHVDNINLLYVALTRAAESMHLFIHRKSLKPAPSDVGGLLWQVLQDPEKEPADRIEFGTFAGPVAPDAATEQAQHVVLKEYPTAPPRLRLRLPSQRYFEEGGHELSPRNFGILMHKAFQEAATVDEIRQAVQQMRDDALLSDADADTLQERIDRALEHPVVRSWFDGSWECVRNEQTIIRPAADVEGMSDDDRTKRPDRVMIKGRKAVVVDYKFGRREGEQAVYRRQIRRYIDLIRRMGYDDCEGYLWYVARGEIERVEA